MIREPEKARAALWPGLIALTAAAGYLIALLAVEKQAFIIALLAVGIIVVIAAAWAGLLNGVSRAFSDHEDALGGFATFQFRNVSGGSTISLSSGVENTWFSMVKL